MSFKSDCDAQADLIFSDYNALGTAIVGANAAQINAKFAALGKSLAAGKDILDDHFGSGVGTMGGVGCDRQFADGVDL